MAKFARSQETLWQIGRRYSMLWYPNFEPCYRIELVECQTQVGSGSQPDTFYLQWRWCFTARDGGSLVC